MAIRSPDVGSLAVVSPALVASSALATGSTAPYAPTALEDPVFTVRHVVQIGLLAVAGLLLAGGAYDNPLSDRLGARSLVGLADICLGVALGLTAVPTELEYGLRVAFVVGGVVIVGIGLYFLVSDGPA